MKALFVTVLLAFWSGCGTSLREVNYRGLVPQTASVNAKLVEEFSASLAGEANSIVIDKSKLTGNEDADETFSVHLRPMSDEKIYVTVMAHFPSRMLFVGVGGNIESPNAKDIAQHAVILYARKYSGSQLVTFTRYQGLLGP